MGFFRYLEEICEIPRKFDAFSAKIGAKIAKFQWFCLKFMKMSPTFATKICWIVEVGEVQRNINLVDLAKSFQTSIYLQKSASIQPRTSYLIFFNFRSLQGFNFHRPPAPSGTSSALAADLKLKNWLYQRWFLQPNTHVAAFLKIYTIYIALHRSEIKILRNNFKQV